MADSYDFSDVFLLILGENESSHKLYVILRMSKEHFSQFTVINIHVIDFCTQRLVFRAHMLKWEKMADKGMEVLNEMRI